jgi:hypothetical protein
MWGAIVDKLDEVEDQSGALDVETEDFDEVEDASIPPSSSTRTTTSCNTGR